MCRAVSFSFFTEDGTNKFLRNVGKYLPDYTASYTEDGIFYERREMLKFCLLRLYKHFATCFQRRVFTRTSKNNCSFYEYIRLLDDGRISRPKHVVIMNT